MSESENNAQEPISRLGVPGKNSRQAIMLAIALVPITLLAGFLYKKINYGPSNAELREWLSTHISLPPGSEIGSLSKQVQTYGFRTNELKLRITLKSAVPLYEIVNTKEYFDKAAGTPGTFDAVDQLRQGPWLGMAQVDKVWKEPGGLLDNLVLVDLQPGTEGEFEAATTVFVTRKAFSGWNIEAPDNMTNVILRRGKTHAEQETDATAKGKKLFDLQLTQNREYVRFLASQAPDVTARLREAKALYERVMAEYEKALAKQRPLLEAETDRLAKERVASLAGSPRPSLQQWYAGREWAATGQRFMDKLARIKSWKGYYISPSGKQETVVLFFLGAGNLYNDATSYDIGDAKGGLERDTMRYADVRMRAIVGGIAKDTSATLYVVNSADEMAILGFIINDNSKNAASDSIADTRVSAWCQITDDYLLGKTNAYVGNDSQGPKIRESCKLPASRKATLAFVASAKLDESLRPAVTKTESQPSPVAPAARTSPDAQYKLGIKYERGDGVPRNATKAAQLYCEAADQGYAKAQYNLGVMYLKGRGVTKNETEAVAWFRKAAEQGLAEAQYNLGLAYATGVGVAKNATAGLAWYYAARDGGMPKIENFIRSLEIKLGSQAVEQARENAKNIENLVLSRATGETTIKTGGIQTVE